MQENTTFFAKASVQEKKVTIKDSLRGSRDEHDHFYMEIFRFIFIVIGCVTGNRVQDAWRGEVCKKTVQQFPAKNA
jgi:hypothetical protein